VSRDGETLNSIEFYKDSWRTPGPIFWVSPANGADQAVGGLDFLKAAKHHHKNSNECNTVRHAAA
jgi:hypothetical protein